MLTAKKAQAPDLLLPLTLLSRYLFFLSRRPISASNTGFLDKRLHSLKSLAPLLQNREDSELDEIVSRLIGLTAANLFRHGSAIQQLLRKRTTEALPRDIVVASEAVPEEFWKPVRRCLLVLGPGIGIGDEIITFLVPSCLARLMPQAEITVLSNYEGLWDCVRCVQSIENYSNAVELLSALRNRDGGYDLVVLVDFEPPDFLPAIACEPR